MSIYRRIYTEHYGPIPVDKDGRTYEIHHIDGNRANNHPSNLVALSIKEHYDIHLNQGDKAACLIISSRMKMSVEEKSRLAREFQLERISNGQHPWLNKENARMRALKQFTQGDHPFLQGEIQRKSAQERVERGTHNFQGSNQNNRMLESGKHPSQMKKQCPHCNLSYSIGMYVRWHGENCKRKDKNETNYS